MPPAAQPSEPAPAPVAPHDTPDDATTDSDTFDNGTHALEDSRSPSPMQGSSANVSYSTFHHARAMMRGVVGTGSTAVDLSAELEMALGTLHMRTALCPGERRV